jgi:hypothetical protein
LALSRPAGALRPLAVAAAAAVCLLCALLGAANAQAATTTYTATQTVPVPPASDFAGSGGGDGWALAFSSDKVYNVFHHLSTLSFACHNQSDATPCYSPETITDGSGNNFATSGQPGLHFDSNTGKLYVFGTRTSDQTAGVVCIDTTVAPTNTNPFCGFTALSAVGDAPQSSGYDDSQIGAPSLIGNHWYAFSFVNAAGQTQTKNELLCFDVSTDAACAGQPFAGNIAIGSDTVVTQGYPPPAQAAIGHRVITPIEMTDGSSTFERLACFDDSTQANCSGSWPVTLASGTGYVSNNGAPFPLMDSTGAIQGLCLPTGTDPCFGLDGSTAATPAGMASVIPGTSGWDGPSVVLGPRVYLADGNKNQVECFDYSTGASCPNFPHTTQNLGLLYTVNQDPQRPTCIWLNADDGSAQIQNFDAYTGGQCGQGDVRVLGSQFVVAQPQCTPASYVSLQINSPAPSTYSGGTVTFDDNDGNPIPGAADRPIDQTGTVNLGGLSLNTPTGLPQFIIALNGTSGSPSQIVMTLTWQADYNASCTGGGVSATPPASGGSGAVPPTNSAPPRVTGTPLPGDRVTCSVGTWSGSPTGYTYVWKLNGVTIPGVTGNTYVVKIGDEAKTLTCVVVAHNSAGSSSPATSKGVLVGYSTAVTCPKPSGKLSGTNVGVFGLGVARSKARKLNHRYQITHNGFDNFCLYAGWGVRVGYPTRQLLASLTKKVRTAVKGKAVLALTANPFYALYGVKPGTKRSALPTKLHLGKPFHVGVNYWYFLPGKRATGVFKVRGGLVQEVGLASAALTQTRAQQRRFIRSFG